jgi:hypothetical protein
MLEQSTAELIFGKQVFVNTTMKTLKIERNPQPDTWQIVAIKHSDCKRSAEHCNKFFSLWEIKLAEPIQKTQRGYVRLRFKVSNPGRLWQWKIGEFGSNGAIIDFRFSDVREALQVPHIDEFVSKIQPIKSMFLFLVAPSSLQCRATSPAVHDVRLLEGKVWERYLDRATSIRGLSKFVIYQWRNERRKNPASTSSDGSGSGGQDNDSDKDLEDIRVSNAFRAFVDLCPDRSQTSLRSHLWTAVLVVILMSLVQFVWDSYNSHPVELTSNIKFLWSAIMGKFGLAGLGLFGLLLWLIQKVDQIREKFKVFRKGYQKFEAFLYNRVMKLRN